jgi:hypothetical protein
VPWTHVEPACRLQTLKHTLSLFLKMLQSQ